MKRPLRQDKSRMLFGVHSCPPKLGIGVTRRASSISAATDQMGPTIRKRMVPRSSSSASLTSGASRVQARMWCGKLSKEPLRPSAGRGYGPVSDQGTMTVARNPASSRGARWGTHVALAPASSSARRARLGPVRIQTRTISASTTRQLLTEYWSARNLLTPAALATEPPLR